VKIRNRRAAADVLLKEMNDLIIFVAENGLSVDQNIPYEVHRIGDVVDITHNGNSMAYMLRNRSYREMYADALSSSSYLFRLFDDSLVQMSFQVKAGELLRSRAAYLPPPSFDVFQESIELFAEDLIFADIIDRRVVAVPIRIDYDVRDHVVVSREHPKSHFTLGQFEGCRLALSAPITPTLFIDLVLKMFYSKALATCSTPVPSSKYRFKRCLDAREERDTHIHVSDSA